MLITTLISLYISLRWLRRTMTVVLIISNFAATVLVQAPDGRLSGIMLIGSILMCLFLLLFTRPFSRKKSGSTLGRSGNILSI